MSEQMNSNDRRKRHRYISVIALSGVTAALVFAATMISVPVGTGYLNMGDGMILLCAYLIGPIVALPAAIGSALTDLALGYTIYIPATFLIKGLLGGVAGWVLRKTPVSVFRKAVAFVAAELIMVGGYFLYEWPLYGLEGAAAQVIPNVIQGAAAIAVAFVLTLLLKGLRDRVQALISGDH
ncbi:MAG: ECF transporter S component [Clostridiales bacterium]|nr:ECF transporter S component [Clostridiales bacterium]